jgi:small subunit ribosomal protein S5
VLTRRVAKVVAGGKHMRFNALVVIGDGRGQVGMGMGKAEAIPDSVRKAVAIARRGLVTVPMNKTTIPHESLGEYGASKILLKPAPAGTGVIAGGTVRAIMEAAGVKDVVTKSIGSRNPVNVVRATLIALQQLRDPQAEEKLRKGETPREPAKV